MKFSLTLIAAFVFLVNGVTAAPLARTASGHPDLSGFYDAGTITPLNRPREFGDKQFMTPAEAEFIMKRAAQGLEAANAPSDPERDAPVVGGDGNQALGAGGVGGYNAFWVDPGNQVIAIDGKIRTSIIYDPPNGRQPPMTQTGRMRMADNFSSFSHRNDGTASWLDHDGPGPFDNPESLALAERCLLGFSVGPPMLPGLYNNFKRIVQTEDHVVILLEMVHDARIIRLGGEHLPPTMRRWFGDSVGRWEGDTLVVDTRNFLSTTGLAGAGEDLHLVERFTLQEDGNLLYDFTVDDPTAWTVPFSGAYVWRKSTDKVFEYACHEGNYSMGNILRGARLLEQEEERRRADAGQ